jgi:hypothetical protein
MTHENSIPVRLSKQEFDDYPSFKGPIPWYEERAWFRHGETLGIVIFDRADQDWAFVVMRQNKDMADLYCAVDLGTGFTSETETTEVLFGAMAWAETVAGSNRHGYGKLGLHGRRQNIHARGK